MNQTTHSNKTSTLVFVPTYNEKENAPRLIAELLNLPVSFDLLFVDDSSPDGTGQILDTLASQHARLHVVHRAGKQGIGSAHLAGIHWAYDHGYTELVTMDCDFTHPPSYIPALLEAGRKSTVAVGSRYIEKNSLPDWNLYRKTLTTLGHFLTRSLLGMKYDATGGFRYYDLKRIPRHFFDLIHSRGYSFFFESLHLVHVNQFEISQIPIHLPARTCGHSKMSTKDILNSVRFLFEIYFTLLFNRQKFLLKPKP